MKNWKMEIVSYQGPYVPYHYSNKSEKVLFYNIIIYIFIADLFFRYKNRVFEFLLYFWKQ